MARSSEDGVHDTEHISFKLESNDRTLQAKVGSKNVFIPPPLLQSRIETSFGVIGDMANGFGRNCGEKVSKLTGESNLRMKSMFSSILGTGADHCSKEGGIDEDVDIDCNVVEYSICCGFVAGLWSEMSLGGVSGTLPTLNGSADKFCL